MKNRFIRTLVYRPDSVDMMRLYDPVSYGGETKAMIHYLLARVVDLKPTTLGKIVFALELREADAKYENSVN